jgi:hypothetical protein
MTQLRQQDAAFQRAMIDAMRANKEHPPSVNVNTTPSTQCPTYVPPRPSPHISPIKGVDASGE